MAYFGYSFVVDLLGTADIDSVYVYSHTLYPNADFRVLVGSALVNSTQVQEWNNTYDQSEAQIRANLTMCGNVFTLGSSVERTVACGTTLRGSHVYLLATSDQVGVRSIRVFGQMVAGLTAFPGSHFFVVVRSTAFP